MFQCYLPVITYSKFIYVVERSRMFSAEAVWTTGSECKGVVQAEGKKKLLAAPSNGNSNGKVPIDDVGDNPPYGQEIPWKPSNPPKGLVLVQPTSVLHSTAGHGALGLTPYNWSAQDGRNEETRKGVGSHLGQHYPAVFPNSGVHGVQNLGYRSGTADTDCPSIKTQSVWEKPESDV